MFSEKVFLLWSDKPERYSKLQDELTKDSWQIVVASRDDELLHYANDRTNRTVCLAILDAMTAPLPSHQVFNIFCSAGHSALIGGCGTEQDSSKLNRLVQKYGLEFNKDCVIRPNLYKNYHPKDALLEDFTANRSLKESLLKHTKSRRMHLGDEESFQVKSLHGSERGPRILFSHGCTLSLKHRSEFIVMMTSSKWAVPSAQAICAFFKDSHSDCRLIALGSSRMCNDFYLELENNKPLLMSLLEFIVEKNYSINMSDARTSEIGKPIYGPDIERLMATPIPCLGKHESLSEDGLTPFDVKLFSIASSLHPTVKRAFETLEVPQKPLTLIKPIFYLKKLSLKPATHNFLLRRPPAERQSTN